jgi:Zn-dependent metalloprotease
MAKKNLTLSLLAMAVSLALTSQVQAQSASAATSEAAARLAAATGNKAEVSYNAATGTARFVRSSSGAPLVTVRAGTDALKQRDSLQFLGNYANLFGITSAASELQVARVTKDQLGRSSVLHRQVFNGVPVFGGELKTHYDQSDRLVAVSGAFVPGIAISTTPKLSAADAAAKATALVKGTAKGRTDNLRSSQPVLLVYRTGLLKGVPGNSHLVWQVTVGNGVDVREFVFVDAHSGKVIEQFTGMHDGLNRRAFDSLGQNQPGPNYPNNPFWVEGMAFPTASAEANNMLSASAEIHDLFIKAFGRDSFDGNGATMDSIFNRGNGCPNASWNGIYISFCPGTTTDDITAHEWGHAYTEYTHGLIYAWQPGALNEAYSDIWGETVDRINGRGGDTPDQARTAGACTASTPLEPTLTVNAPGSIAGSLPAGGASFGLQSFSLTSDLVQVKSGGAQSVGCTVADFTASGVAGKVAFVDRGVCGFAVKADNASAAGATGLVIGNNQGGTAVISMSGAMTQPAIPVLSISQTDGTAVKGRFAANETVNVTMTRGGFGSDNSVRWLMGEDSTGFGGAIRDMYNPTCYGQPAKVNDRQYLCAAVADNTTDQGGVHVNSGVPNHAFALLVDGGSYNGQTISSIGLTKAAHIYYRAQAVYQGPTTDFAGHADALEQSCRDLTGVNLKGLKTGTPSGEIIAAGDCAQVSKAMLAVEMRLPPTQCNYQPILAKNPPALCPAGSPVTLASDTFEGGRRGSLKWVSSSVAGSAEFLPRNWGVQTNLPGGRAGSAMFAGDPNFLCSGSDQSGVLRLESPEITVPAASQMDLRMAFDHYVATEPSWDGGNLKISVNGGAWTQVSASNFVYNAYNATLATAGQGNTNPIAGQAAFTGTDAGSLAGSWGRSIINLAPYAVPGDKVRIRFEFGGDYCGGNLGWYVDDVSVYQCARVSN